MSFDPPLITVSLCELRDGEYHSRHSTLVSESELSCAFEAIGGTPIIANRWTITFHNAPKIRNVTHIAFTARAETMGMVIPLSREIGTRKGDTVHFPPGSVSFTMMPSDTNRIARVIR